MASARPSRGATSTAPERVMTSTAMRRSAKKRRVTSGWAVATRCPARSAIGPDGRVRRHGRGKAAAAVAERAQDGQLGAGLGEEVLAGDPEVGHAVADELDDVVRAHEEDVDRRGSGRARRGSGRAPRRRGRRRGAGPASVRRGGPCWGSRGGARSLMRSLGPSGRGFGAAPALGARFAFEMRSSAPR